MSCFPSAEVGWVPELWVQISGPIQAGPLSTWPTWRFRTQGAPHRWRVSGRTDFGLRNRNWGQ